MHCTLSNFWHRQGRYSKKRNVNNLVGALSFLFALKHMIEICSSASARALNMLNPYPRKLSLRKEISIVLFLPFLRNFLAMCLLSS